MIIIKTLDSNDEVRTWKYEDKDALEREWRSDSIDMDVPENDAEVISCEVDDKKIFDAVSDYTFKRIGTDTVWFEDLLTYFDIEIWG